MKNTKVTFDNKATYLAMIRASVGSTIFRHLYGKVGSKKTDLLRDGDLSCAFFVSSILVLRGLISSVHSTVGGTVRDLEQSGWKEIKKLKEGSVVLWEETKGQSGEMHSHLGFFIGDDKVISNVPKKKSPQIHHITYGLVKGEPKRKIDKIFWHPSLGK